MTIPAAVIGFSLVVLGKLFFGKLRAKHLARASQNIVIDTSNEITLEHTTWDYVFPCLGFVLSLMFGIGANQDSPHPEAILIYKIACVICFLGGIFMFYREWTGRIIISNGKLTYKEGFDRWEIQAAEVFGFSLNGFAFWVKLKSGRTLKIPATFRSSELILAFLRQASLANTKI